MQEKHGEGGGAEKEQGEKEGRGTGREELQKQGLSRSRLREGAESEDAWVWELLRP